MNPKRILTNTLPLAVALALAAPAISAAPWWHQDQDEEELEFGKAELFFELNDTDGDLGLHAVVDGEAWKQLWITDRRERVLLQVVSRGSLRRQGLNEINFESAEPSFDELPPNQFMARFPEGTYEIEAITLEGAELSGEVEISHVMPAAPEVAFPEESDCEAPTDIAGPVTVSWEEVTSSHPEVGAAGPIEMERYELAIEKEDTPFHFFLELPPDMTSFAVPAQFLAEPGVVQFEILAKATNGNRSATVGCFNVPE